MFVRLDELVEAIFFELLHSKSEIFFGHAQKIFLLHRVVVQRHGGIRLISGIEEIVECHVLHAYRRYVVQCVEYTILPD